MAQVIKDVVTWLKQWFYTEDEIDTITGSLQSQINNKAEASAVTSLNNAISSKADAVHGHDANEITISRGYAHIGTNSGVTQKDVNDAINIQIGALKNVELISLVTSGTLPTASADTMNKLYVLAKSGGATGDGYDIWVTIKTGTSSNPSYNWEKIDDFDLQNLNVDWSSVTNKPSTFPPESHAHGNITSAGKIGSTNGGKPVILDSQSKVSAGEFGTTAGTFAEGNHTHSEYTNPTIADNLSTNNAAQVLSAKQGKVLNDNKADKTVAIGTTITLVDKGETNEGCIIFNTIS